MKPVFNVDITGIQLWRDEVRKKETVFFFTERDEMHPMGIRKQKLRMANSLVYGTGVDYCNYNFPGQYTMSVTTDVQKDGDTTFETVYHVGTDGKRGDPITIGLRATTKALS